MCFSSIFYKEQKNLPFINFVDIAQDGYLELFFQL